MRNTSYLLITCLLLGLLLVGCNKKEKEEVQPRMTLSAKLNGRYWQATNFLVSRQSATPTEDAHLIIQPSRIDDHTRMYLYLYDVEKPGTYTIANNGNSRRYNCGMEIINPQKASFDFFGSGPATFHFSKVEEDRFVGTFTASFYDPAKETTIEVTEGQLDVFVGTCNKEGWCTKLP
jgi:hypothetical protein